MLRKVGVVKAPRPGDALSVLSDAAWIIENFPGVVGLQGGRVRVEFRRLLFRFTDSYRVGVERAEGSVVVEMEGERSRVRLRYTAAGDHLEAYASYEGPRGWLVWGRLRRAALGLAERAVKEASERRGRGARRGPGGLELSERLADLSWVSWLLLKSMLVESREVLVNGGVHDLVEWLHSSGVLGRYRVVYVSARGNGVFRLLFVDGRLAGVYAVIGGEERVGDARALNSLTGLFKVRVYGSLAPLEEVVAGGG